MKLRLVDDHPHDGGGRGSVPSDDARANRAAACLKADAAGLEEVGDGGEGFAAVAALVAYGEDEVAEGKVAMGDFEGLFHGAFVLGIWLGLGKVLRNACTEDTTVVGQADASAFEEVGHRGGGLVGVPAHAADRENEVTEGEGLAAAGLEGGGFHGWVLFAGSLLVRILY